MTVYMLLSRQAVGDPEIMGGRGPRPPAPLNFVRFAQLKILSRPVLLVGTATIRSLGHSILPFYDKSRLEVLDRTGHEWFMNTVETLFTHLSDDGDLARASASLRSP